MLRVQAETLQQNSALVRVLMALIKGCYLCAIILHNSANSDNSNGVVGLERSSARMIPQKSENHTKHPKESVIQ